MISVGPADHYNYVTGKCLSTLVHVATVASGRLIIIGSLSTNNNNNNNNNFLK